MHRFFLASLGLLLSCNAAFAQLANTTTLLGSVSDSAGAAMAGVSVTAVNNGTQESYRSTTNGEGRFTVEFLKSGTYNVTASSPGFSTLTKSDIVVNSNQTVRTDFTLAVGQVTEQIVVSGGVPPISTDDAAVKEVISSKSVIELPLNGRDPLQLATTAPGVIQGLKGTNGVPPGEAFIGAGTREIQNSISLDGISIVNNLITTTPFHPSPDAIQELEVQSGTYSAQYGAYLGVHLNLITKSGTNGLHGAVWEFFRNDKLDAKNFFQSATSRKAPLRQNQFGFQIGGPVYIPKLYDGRNKTFFMADYEGLRSVRKQTERATVLTPLMRAGDFSEVARQLNPVNGTAFPGNRIPTNLLSQQTQRVLQYMPLPNLTGTTNNYEATYPFNDRFNQTIDRLDQNIGDKVRLYFRYALNNELYLTGATGPFNYTYVPVSTNNWVGGYTHTITPNIVNDFRVGRQNLTTDALNYWYQNNITGAGTALGIPGFNNDTVNNIPGIPTFTNTGLLSLGNGATNWFQFDTTWQGTDSLTYTHGAHTLVFGAELRKLITSRAAVNSPNGQFEFNSNNLYTGYVGADLILGLAQRVTTPAPQVRNQVAAWRDGFFIVDNWQASKRLTVNLGIRYELPTVPYTVNGFATVLNPAQNALIPSTVPQPGFHFINPNHKNFAPRIGLAYRATDKTVFRAGYGIYYNPNQTNTYTFLSANPPFSAITSCTASANAFISLDNPTPASACGVASIFNIISPNPNLPTPYMNQWSFGIQQGLWNSGALDVQYLGSHSTHLDRSYYINTPRPGSRASVSSRRPNPLFGDIRIIQNDEIANYNGLSVTLRQRVSHGATALVSYTWSHTLDVSTDSNGGGFPQDPFNWGADYGNANWDLRHRFVASFSYALPFFSNSSNGFLKQGLGGWQTNGIVTLQSGLPFNVTVPGDPANTGRSGERPNLVGTASSSCGRDGLVNCIDPSAFQTASLAYGNFGRNVLYGPGLYNVDFSVFKNFSIAERATVQFRSEFFNLLNTPALNNPNAVFGTTNFGSITSTRRDNRQIQFALKLLF